MGLQDLELTLWEVSPYFLATKQMSLCWSGLVGVWAPWGAGQPGERAPPVA